jgi:hypothetical protein
MRYFNSDARCQAGVAHLLPLPVDELFPDGKVSHISDTAVPELLIVHFQLPYETPTMFRAKTDGAGGEVVLYLKPSQRFIEEISGERHMTPATHLFQRWCRLSETQPELRKRFKCMALVNDLEKLGLSWLKPYNGKPVLITESGSVRRGTQDGVRYLEFSCNGTLFINTTPRGYSPICFGEYGMDNFLTFFLSFCFHTCLIIICGVLLLFGKSAWMGVHSQEGVCFVDSKI